MIKHRLVWSSNKIHSRDISPQLKFCFIFFQNMFFGASKKILFQRYEFMSGELIVRSVSSYFNIWLVVYLPLLKKWVRQLGWWNSQSMESHKIHVPKPPTSEKCWTSILDIQNDVQHFQKLHLHIYYIFTSYFNTFFRKFGWQLNNRNSSDQKPTLRIRSSKHPTFRRGKWARQRVEVKWNTHRNRWFTYEKWWFSIAIC